MHAHTLEADYVIAGAGAVGLPRGPALQRMAELLACEVTTDHGAVPALRRV